MRAMHWGAGAIGLCWVMAGVVAASCSLDQRKFSLPGLRDPDAGVRDGGAVELGPRLEISPSSIDLGSVTTGFPARARVLVRNTGDGPLLPPAVTWAEGSAPDFAIIQNRCEQEVAPGQSCELRIQVVPAQAGELQGELHVESAAGASGPNLANVGVAALGLEAGDLVLAPLAGSFEDYGGVLVGVAEEGAFTLSNPTNIPTGVLQIGVNRAEFTLLEPGEGDCVPNSTSLEPAQSCNVRLAFAPGERGSVDATLTIGSDGAGSVSLTLAGRGLVPGVLQTSTRALDFEGVLIGQSATRTATFANSGDEPLALAGVSLEPTGVEGFAIAESDCSAEAPLEGGKSCRVQVELRPPRAGEPLTAELVIAQVGAAAPLGIPASGVGLLPGALEAKPGNEGDDDFGDVLVGETVERTLVIGNPGAQPSGVLDLSIGEGFEIVAPPGPGECVPGTTSLVDGQTCSVRVRFTPTGREAVDGALTVSSSLLGAVALPISGRGVVAGQLEVAPEINFGRVLTGASAQRPLTVTNTGDQPLAPPTLEVTGDAAQRAAFTFESACAAPVEPGQACEVTLSFAPTVAEPHAADLKLASGASTAAVLLLGEALTPGSLTLAAAPGGSAEFGDVAIGTTASRSFTLSNPGSVPSGTLTITTDNNQFEATPGDCNQGDPAGLVDTTSCTFSVIFTPASSQAVVANVSVQSPGAGRAGLQISGRGRTKATLTASAANKDLGRAILGQDALTVPENEFTWALVNGGDLATGPLVASNDNMAEFAVGADTCSGVELAGQASCQLVIRFRPGGAGVRTGHLTLRDPVGMGSVALTLTGTGVQLAPPGGDCTEDSECAEGVCTLAKCCDKACARPCEACVEGVCTEKAANASCGNVPGAVCFDVDSCKLPVGQACGSADECGDGFCERRLDGAGEDERVCCRQACPDGQGCNAEGACIAPTLSVGDTCSGPGDPRCGELVCTRCVDSELSQCTLPGACCGECQNGLECAEGTCQCPPVGADGPRGTLCNGVCVGGGDACCPNVLSCSNAATPFCDPVDNRCKECGDSAPCTSEERPFCGADNTCKACLQNEHCVLVPFGSVPECGTDGVCRFPCGEPEFTDCNGTCIAAGTCCCAGNDVCQPDGVTCAPRCTPGVSGCNPVTGAPQVCGADGVLSDTQACPSGQECKLPSGQCGCTDAALTLCGTQCVDTLSDEANCNFCGTTCALGELCNAGVCEPALPELGEECINGVCGQGLCSAGICCDRNCQAPCETCATGTCQILASRPQCACAPVLADADCTAPPLVAPPPDLPAGEGQCDLQTGQCLNPDQVCPQPIAAGPCANGTGTCGDDGTGFIRCTVPETPVLPALGEPCDPSVGCDGAGVCAGNGICCDQFCEDCTICEAGTGQCVPTDSRDACSNPVGARGFCDGSGVCELTEVSCGFTNCPIDTTSCCLSAPDSFACNPECLAPALTLRCDEASDCGPGDVCCFDPGLGSSCRPEASCGAPSGLLCSTPVFQATCPDGSPCNQLAESATFSACSP